jgi:hypothetical protein
MSQCSELHGDKNVGQVNSCPTLFLYAPLRTQIKKEKPMRIIKHLKRWCPNRQDYIRNFTIYDSCGRHIILSLAEVIQLGQYIKELENEQ